MALLWICLGGAVGTAARYGMQTWAKQALGGGFPWGTLAVNLIGSFFIGAIMYVALNTHVVTETVQAMQGRHPDMDLFEVPDQGHVPALAGHEILSKVAQFVAACDRPSANS